MREESDRAFINRVAQSISGWVEDYALIRTMDLLRYQEEQQVRGPLLEIGVFCGKYLSLLIRSALSSGDRVVGIDTFQFTNREIVCQDLQKYFEEPLDNLSLLQAASCEFDPLTMIELLAGKPRFISIDGSHELCDVYLDLSLSDSILSEDGVVAVDDFLNPLTLGVNQAVHSFFSQPRRIVPFAYLSNKLFLSRPATAARLRVFLEKVSVGDSASPAAQEFTRRLQHDRTSTEQSLYGHTILIAS